MIQQQLEIPLSPYTGLYDIVVPQDDIYRQLDRLVDFSFVYEEIGKNYSWKKGRFAEDPVRMFKYLLVKIIDKLSDRRVVANALVNLSIKRFLGLSPEVTDKRVHSVYDIILAVITYSPGSNMGGIYKDCTSF